jgi:hypothetical protein
MADRQKRFHQVLRHVGSILFFLRSGGNIPNMGLILKTVRLKLHNTIYLEENDKLKVSRDPH